MDYTQKQALPLIELTDEDTGLTCSDARDGFHFIALTALERSTLPDIVSINRPYKSSPKHESEYFATEDDGPITDPDVMELIKDTLPALFPTAKWKRSQSEKFQQLQIRISTLRETVQNDLSGNDDDCPQAHQDELWLEYCKANEPLLGRILRVGQRNLERLLEYQSNWLENNLEWFMENCNWIFPWIYCSLVCLKIPLEGDVINSMRKIAKTCYEIRKLMKTEHINEATPLNLIIRIVSINFRQHDLGDIPLKPCDH